MPDLQQSMLQYEGEKKNLQEINGVGDVSMINNQVFNQGEKKGFNMAPPQICAFHRRIVMLIASAEGSQFINNPPPNVVPSFGPTGSNSLPIGSS